MAVPPLRRLRGARRRAAIERDRERLAVLIERLGDALIVTGTDDVVRLANARARALAPDLLPGARVAPGRLPLREQALAGEVTVEREGGTFAVTAATLPDDGSDTALATVWTIRDISERARLERLKSEFVATASHELRSPLTSIKGFVELLQNTEGLDVRQREFVEIILLSTNRLADLVNDLLDVARIEAGRVEIHPRAIDLGAVVREVVMLLRPRLRDRHQELALEIPPALPRAFADPSRMRQVVTNLVTNAHLHSSDGAELRVAIRPLADDLELVVADDGPGLEPAAAEQVFDRFYSGPGGGAGTGLGLSIVRSLVELHGGRVTLRTAPGEGAEFVVRIPLAPESEPRELPRQVMRGTRVLIVDDEPEIARLIALELGALEVETEVAANGEEALRRLRSERFDAVTLDLLMPGMGGLELLAELRDDPELQRLPVVVVSVFAGREALAGEWVVSKPIDTTDLVETLAAAVVSGRTTVLVAGRAEVRDELRHALADLGIEHDWVQTATEAGARCRSTRFEVALVDAGMDDLPGVLSALDLRGRRIRRAVILFQSGEDGPALATLPGEPVPLADAAQAVVTALGEPPEPGR